MGKRRLFSLANSKGFAVKYIIGEVLLLFIGINLAIQFNNWNSARQAKKSIEIAIEKINEETTYNKNELENSIKSYHKIIAFLTAHKEIGNFSTDIVTSVDLMSKFRKDFSDFYIVKDSSKLGLDKYNYKGIIGIEVEVTDLKSIAWETAKSASILDFTNYNCLYELESVYNLQEKVKISIDNAMSDLYNGNFEKLLRSLKYLVQLQDQLIKTYDKLPNKLLTCKS